MTVKKGNQYCGEHGTVTDKHSDNKTPSRLRVACPLDNSQ